MGLSIVWVEFDWGTDIYRNRQIVQEKLQLATTHLPPGVVPHMAPISSIMGQIQLIGVRSRDRRTTDPTEIRALVDQHDQAPPALDLGRRPGGRDRRGAPPAPGHRRRREAARLRRRRSRRSPRRSASANVQRLRRIPERSAHAGPLVTVTGLVQEAAELAQRRGAPRSRAPGPHRGRRRVEFGPAAIRTGDAGIDGGPGVILTITKQPDVDTVELTGGSTPSWPRSRRRCPTTSRSCPTLFRQADFIQRAIDNVIDAVRDGVAPRRDRPLPVPAELPHDADHADRDPALDRRRRRSSSPLSASRSTR